jgi:hypothetical protein
MPTYVPWGFLEQTSPPSPCALGEGGSRKHSENERAGATSLHRAAGGGTETLEIMVTYLFFI